MGTEVGQYFWVAPVAYCCRIIQNAFVAVSGSDFWKLEKIVNYNLLLRRAQSILSPTK